MLQSELLLCTVNTPPPPVSTDDVDRSSTLFNSLNSPLKLYCFKILCYVIVPDSSPPRLATINYMLKKEKKKSKIDQIPLWVINHNNVFNAAYLQKLRDIPQLYLADITYMLDVRHKQRKYIPFNIVKIKMLPLHAV